MFGIGAMFAAWIGRLIELFFPWMFSYAEV
jgi:hypothetical protein